MFLNMPPDIRGLEHGISQQIHINRQREVVYFPVQVQQFIHTDTLPQKKEINI